MNHSVAIPVRNQRLKGRGIGIGANSASVPRLALILFSLLLLGLQMPKVSTILFPLLVLVFARERMQFLGENLLVFLFSVTYFSFALFYGELLPLDAIRFIIMAQAAYCLGVYIPWTRLPFWPYNTMLAIVAFGGGMLIYAFLSFQVTLASAAYLIPKRSFLAYWSGEIGNGIVMFDFAGPLIALLPVAMIGLSLLRRQDFTLSGWIFRAMLYLGVIVMGLLGCYINAYMQTRGPFIMLAMVMPAVFLYYLRKQHVIISAKTFLKVIGMGVILFFIIINFIGIDAPFEIIASRFASSEFETSRYYMWGQGLKSLIANPFGGVEINRGLLGDSYFHSFWLDVGRCAGILPLIPLVTFQIIHLRSMFTIVKHAKNPLLGSMVISLGIFIFFIYMYEPGIIGGVYFLLFSFFAFGIFRYIGRVTTDKQAGTLQKGIGTGYLRPARGSWIPGGWQK